MPTAFRLTTGEYLIAERFERVKGANKLLLINPYQMAMQQEGSMVRLHFQPWLGVSQANLYVHSICADIAEEYIPSTVLEGYMQASSGVAIARQMPGGNA